MNITDSSAIWFNPRETKVYIEGSSKTLVFEKLLKFKVRSIREIKHKDIQGEKYTDKAHISVVKPPKEIVQTKSLLTK